MKQETKTAEETLQEMGYTNGLSPDRVGTLKAMQEYHAQFGSPILSEEDVEKYWLSKYKDEWQVIERLNQHPEGLNFNEWKKKHNVLQSNTGKEGRKPYGWVDKDGNFFLNDETIMANTGASPVYSSPSNPSLVTEQTPSISDQEIENIFNSFSAQEAEIVIKRGSGRQDDEMSFMPVLTLEQFRKLYRSQLIKLQGKGEQGNG